MDDIELLKEALEALEYAGCQFDMCEGPTLEPTHMLTCNNCHVIAQLQERINKER